MSFHRFSVLKLYFIFLNKSSVLQPYSYSISFLFELPEDNIACKLAEFQKSEVPAGSFGAIST